MGSDQTASDPGLEQVEQASVDTTARNYRGKPPLEAPTAKVVANVPSTQTRPGAEANDPAGMGRHRATSSGIVPGSMGRYDLSAAQRDQAATARRTMRRARRPCGSAMAPRRCNQPIAYPLIPHPLFSPLLKTRGLVAAGEAVFRPSVWPRGKKTSNAGTTPWLSVLFLSHPAHRSLHVGAFSSHLFAALHSFRGYSRLVTASHPFPPRQTSSQPLSPRRTYRDCARRREPGNWPFLTLYVREHPVPLARFSPRPRASLPHVGLPWVFDAPRQRTVVTRPGIASSL